MDTIFLDGYTKVDLQRGIPVTINVPINSFFSQFKFVEILPPEEVLVPYLMSPGRFEVEKRPRFKYVKRPDKELELLESMRRETVKIEES